VLQGQVDVRDGVGGEGLEQGLVHAVGLEVEETDPDGPQRLELRQEAREPAPSRPLPARGVLADEHELARAAGESRLGFTEDLRRRHGRVHALDQRDGTVRAAAVAAVRELHVGVDGTDATRRRRPGGVGAGPGARGRLRRARLHSAPVACGRRRARLGGQRADQRAPVEPRPEIHLGQRRRELAAISLHQTAHGGDARAARMRRRDGIEDGGDRLLLGGVDEAAGVDDHDVGVRRPSSLQAALLEGAFEAGGIGLVLGAAESLDEEARGAQR